MEKKTFTNRKVVIGVIGGIFFVFIFLMAKISFFTDRGNGNETDSILLDTGWNVNVSGTEYEDAVLSELYFPVVNKGEETVLSVILPEKIDIETPQLAIMSIHSFMKVYVDGEVIYSYGEQMYQQNSLIGYGYHYIKLPDHCEGKKLQIELYCNEDDAYSRIDPVKIMEMSTSCQKIIRNHGVSFALIVFLIVFGISLFVVSFVMSFFAKKIVKLVCIAVFSVFVGMWTICNCDFVGVFGVDLWTKTYMEYFFLYTMPLPAFLYFREEIEECKNRVLTGLFYFFELFLGLFNVTAIVLNQFTAIHFPAVLKPFHLLSIIMIGYLFWVIIYRKRKKMRANSVLVLGMIILAIIIMFEIAVFNIIKYTGMAVNTDYSSILCVSEFLIILILIGDFCGNVKNTVYNDAKRKTLESLAYKDVMTGLFNRRKCEEIMDELDNQKKSYGMISIDLNDLKKINDTKGHMIGDQLIESFGDILQQFFEKFQCGRMGGDEFVVFIENIEAYDVEKGIADFKAVLEDKNKHIEEFQLSMAYGYARSTEAENSREVYRIADSRMYENKRAIKGKKEYGMK